MEEQFVPYELAFKLKELGFNERCLHIWKYNSMITMIEEEKKKDLEYAKWATSEGLAKYVLSDWHSGTLVPLFTKQDQCLAPLWQQAFDWFEYNYNLQGNTTYFIENNNKYYLYSINKLYKNHIYRLKFETKEKAKIECLKRLIEIIEYKNIKRNIDSLTAFVIVFAIGSLCIFYKQNERLNAHKEVIQLMHEGNKIRNKHIELIGKNQILINNKLKRYEK